MEAGWIRFVVEGTSAMAFEMTPESFEERAAEFELLPDETLEGVLAHYDDVAARTVAVIAAEPDLRASHPLPDAPWFEPGASWSPRLVLPHPIAYPAHTTAPADLLQDTIDSQQTTAT